MASGAVVMCKLVNLVLEKSARSGSETHGCLGTDLTDDGNTHVSSAAGGSTT